MRSILFAALFVLAAFAQESKPAKSEDDDDPRTPVADLRANKDENKRYLLMGPTPKASVPKDGYRLLVVLPGGPGGADFKTFVRNIRSNVLTDDWLVAELVAVMWKPDQETIWPDKLSPVTKMRFTTDEFVADVVAEVGKKHKLDKRYSFVMGWSSSGHVVYNLSLQEKPLFTGFYVAMAVFHPRELPPLKAAKDRAYFIDHSPDDERCPFKDAETARDALKKAGAKVELVTYKGGHGWFDDPFARMKRGIRFLEEQGAGAKK